VGLVLVKEIGSDALFALHLVSPYRERVQQFHEYVKKNDLALAVAQTDVKGDRSKAPHEQSDPDMFVHVTRRTAEGIYIKGATAHQTGCINSHWLIVMPTMRLGAADKSYAVIGALPVDSPALTMCFIIGGKN